MVRCMMLLTLSSILLMARLVDFSMSRRIVVSALLNLLLANMGEIYVETALDA